MHLAFQMAKWAAPPLSPPPPTATAAAAAPPPSPPPALRCRHAPTMDQLRHDPRIPFEALPPVEQLALAGPESHR